MASKHLIPVILVLFMWTACSSPKSPIEENQVPAISAFSNADFREIHNLKNRSQTVGLLEFLQHDDASYRAEAAMAMGSVQDSMAIPELSQALRDSAPEVRMMAAFALGQLRIPRAADPLIDLVERDTTTEVRTEALEAIGKCGGNEAAAFLENYTPRFLFDESGQAWGIYHLSLKGEATARHAKRITELLGSPYSESRLAACFFLNRYREPIPNDQLELLIPLSIRDEADEIRMAATRALKHHPIPGSTKSLEIAVTRDPYPGVRVAAIESLMDVDSASVRETIWQAVQDGNPNVALTAARYFENNFNENDAHRIRQQAIAHPSANVRATLYRALMSHDPNNEIAKEVKRQFNEADKPGYKAGLIIALGTAAEKVSFIDSLVDSKDPVIASAALLAIAENHKLFLKTCADFQLLTERVLQNNDFGQLAILGTMMQNDEIGFKECMDGADRIRTTMAGLAQPEALEAWIELNRAFAHISGNPLQAQPEQNYRAIDWAALSQLPVNPVVRVLMEKGAIELVLLPQDAPATVSYFLKLMQDGYFNGKPFHRVVPNFVVQTGCSRGDGYGGTGEILRSEFSPLHYGPGVVGMASAGKDTESSQWFVTHRTTPHLDGRYTIFAAVVDGMDVVWQLEEGDKIQSMELIQDEFTTP